ncbi:putative ankyrin repeat protein RF_0381 [Liolophura sinensis]|uniref:putative ankyrin repeat protein RF_0381 n=1 Tax=Liolophura sinensis TaxID=3198878 RepID=UPI00315911E1
MMMETQTCEVEVEQRMLASKVSDMQGEEENVYTEGDEEYSAQGKSGSVETSDIQQFYHALVEGDMDTIGLMVRSRRVDINHIFSDSCIQSWHRGQGAIHLITRKGKVNLIKTLVDIGASVRLRNKTGDTSLHIACKYGFHECAEYLLRCDPELKDAQNNQGLTPLVKAVFRFENAYRYDHAFRFNYMKTIRHLVENHVNVNLCPASGITPLHIAAGKGDADLLRLLKSGGANVNAICSKGFSPLLTALCRTRIHTESIKLLLDSGADVNVCTVAGRTALHLAVSKSDDISVQHLLDAGADPNYQDNYSKTPLWIAVHENNIQIVPMLIKFGGNVNHFTLPSRESLLSLAIQKQFEKMARLLVANGADVSAESALSATPLHRAVEVQSVAMVKLLLLHNCYLEEESNSQRILCPQTPLQLVLETGHLPLIQLLMRAGCKAKEVWLQQDNLSIALTCQPAIIPWILDYFYSPKSLSHIATLACRRLLGRNIMDKVASLVSDRYIPAKAGQNILMLDLLC